MSGSIMGNVFDNSGDIKGKKSNPSSVQSMYDFVELLRGNSTIREEFHNNPLKVMGDNNVPTYDFYGSGADIAILIVDSEIGKVTLWNDDPAKPTKDTYYAIIPAPPMLPKELEGAEESEKEAYLKTRKWEDAWDRATATSFGM